MEPENKQKLVTSPRLITGTQPEASLTAGPSDAAAATTVTVTASAELAGSFMWNLGSLLYSTFFGYIPPLLYSTSQTAI